MVCGSGRAVFRSTWASRAVRSRRGCRGPPGLEPASPCSAGSSRGADAGASAARDAGVTTLVTVSEYTCEDNFAGAALVLDHLGEPDRPFTVISGDAGDGSYVTVDLLRELHAQCR